jgi:hypothetical protein
MEEYSEILFHLQDHFGISFLAASALYKHYVDRYSRWFYFKDIMFDPVHESTIEEFLEDHRQLFTGLDMDGNTFDSFIKDPQSLRLFLMACPGGPSFFEYIPRRSTVVYVEFKPQDTLETPGFKFSGEAGCAR